MGFDNSNKMMKFDVRLLEYNLNQGIITQEEYDQYLKTLPDLKEKTISVELDETQVDGSTH